jgi:uncharacterized protein (TIGR02001 family)
MRPDRAVGLCLACSGLVAGTTHAQALQLEGRFGTQLVEQGLSLTRGEPGVWLHGEYGARTGFYAGLDAHNIDFVPNGALDRNLFVRISPYVGWRFALGEAFRLSGEARYVYIPDAIPDTRYPVFEAALDWRERVRASINHSPDRFGLGESTTDYEVAGTWPLRRGLALRGVGGFHDFNRVGGSDYAYAGVGIIASTPKFDIAVDYHVLDGDGDRMFGAVGGQPGVVLTLIGRSGDAPDWASEAGPAWLDRVSVYGELRTEYISSGIAQTLRSPAVQLAMEYASPGGTYFELWGSNVDYTANGDPVEGADTEIDYTLGHRFTLSKDWNASARAAWYAYPGAIDRKSEWDEGEAIVEATWRERLRLKAGYVPRSAGVHEPRAAYAVRWKQPLGDTWKSSIELGYKDKRDWGQSYEWGMVQVSRPVGPFDAIVRYWYTAPRGRRDNGTADPTFEFALGWSL